MKHNFNNNNRSNSVYIAAFLTAVLVSLFFIYRATNADLKEVQVVVKSAQDNPAAVATVESALKKNPTPTVSELAEIKTTVDYLGTQKTISKVPEGVNTQPVQPKVELHSLANNEPMGWVVKTLLILGLLCSVALISIRAVYNKN